MASAHETASISLHRKAGQRAWSSSFMALCVFLQFFTRYVLNDSYAWTEEIATWIERANISAKPSSTA